MTGEGVGVGDLAVTGSAATHVGEGDRVEGRSSPFPCVPTFADLVNFDAQAPVHPAKRARECRDRFGFGLPRLYQLIHRGLRDDQNARRYPVEYARATRLRAERIDFLNRLRRLDAVTRPTRCGWCDGTGSIEVDGRRTEGCPRCDGSGELA